MDWVRIRVGVLELGLGGEVGRVGVKGLGMGELRSGGWGSLSR